MPAMESFGSPSFLIKATKILFKINAGEKSRITFRYVFVISKTALPAPSAAVMLFEKKIPAARNTALKTAARNSVFVNTLFCAFESPLLLETAVELARRKAVVEPSIVVPQGYQGRVQYLLPICLTDMEQPDLAMTLTIMDGYYLGNTCLTLEMAYLNARLLSRPVAHWLTDIVEE